ncbi:type 1 glutamine amidotransferase family protein [Nocardia gipuzkoensis]|uniref:type 1 glutamine amidotransferase family protein n=1 Tax=Nocardia gipuzkoensis TaxID=2749991 RepID=UPI00237E33CD|nr:type 1 glutamine amidotransferase family protein [Nocardia gipuzkoensis]MDE1668858.1 glutamine amidotransferase [Nocardia gipuzkoensis]
MTTKAVHMAVYDTLADWEVGAATAHINKPSWHREPGTWQVRTVGLSAEPITTMGGMRIVPDAVLADLTPADSAMLILPGAETWEGAELDPFTHKAREFVAAGVPVAAICGATFGLAKAGLLDTRKHTSNVAEFLLYSGYSGADHYVEAPAVTDGDVITASASAPFEFAREVLGRLGVYEPHVLDGWYRLFAHADPAGWAVLAEYDAQHA